MTARAIMVLGTGSHVGKSLTTAALCRIFARAGYRVAPFKAQNMSLNSAVTPDGYEIGRAQALQAEAAGIAPSVHMNPVLIKPSGDCASQVVVRGKVWGNLDAHTYHQHRAITLLPIIEESYHELAATQEVIVVEGAGSPAEINLKDNDIVNMRIAKLANAPCLLVGDIDRGGVFASLLGTCELLDEEERRYIRGLIINKFRGDQSLLLPGVRMMEQRLQKPCIGVIPWLDELALDEEDSVGFGNRDGLTWIGQQAEAAKLQIAVIAFPSISNFTDFAPLLAEPSVSLRYVREPEQLKLAGLVILPGSKQTVQDLRWLRGRGFEPALRQHVLLGGLLVGICGGFQMLGESIRDPLGMESNGSERGLELLPVHTTMTREKTTIPARGTLKEAALFGIGCCERHIRGYEIHIGESEYLPGAIPFAEIRRLNREQQPMTDGCVSQDRRVFGTYLHGIFDQDEFRHALLKAARAALRLPVPLELAEWRNHRERQLDRLADAFAHALNLNAVSDLLGLPPLADWRKVAQL
jgi:adenosylcobyric acid synthase